MVAGELPDNALRLSLGSVFHHDQFPVLILLARDGGQGLSDILVSAVSRNDNADQSLAGRFWELHVRHQNRPVYGILTGGVGRCITDPRHWSSLIKFPWRFSSYAAFVTGNGVRTPC